MRDLGVLPRDFWAMTPAEIRLLVDGETTRREEEWERIAWQTALIMNLFTKREITPRKLLGPRWRKGKREEPRLDHEARFEEAWKRHEIRSGMREE